MASLTALSRPSGMGSLKAQPAMRGLPIGRQALRVTAKAVTKKSTKNAAMVCVDCGWIYDGKKGAFEDLPGTYSCPVCGANKKRFKSFQGNVSRANDAKTMNSRREALLEQLEERGESVGEDTSFLITTAASAALFLGAVYYFGVLAR